MKIMLFTLIASWLSVFGYCQDTKMTGIGPFRIGETTESIITDISKETKVKIKPTGNISDTRSDYSYVVDKKTTKIFKLENKLWTEDLPNIAVYYINIFNVADVVMLQQVYLFFLNGKLYKIKCNSSTELSNVMDLKYGKGNTDISEKTYTCRSGVGVEYKEVAKSYYTTWKINNSDLDCSSMASSYFDNKCEEQFISVFEVVHKQTEKDIYKEVSEKKERETKDQEEAKKKKLKDF